MYNDSMFHSKVLISVCIPVYNTEKYLFRCLESVANQSFKNKEIVIFNDDSTGTDEQGNDFNAIIKMIKKKYHVSMKIIKPGKNEGLLEARRNAVYEAKGKYVCIVDSDDFLEKDALQTLYDAAEKNNADIVQGKVNVVSLQHGEMLEKSELEQKYLHKILAANSVFLGEMTKNEIFEGFILKHNHCGFLWGKLFLKEVYLEALNHIPFMYCTMAEDFLQYFFISFEAKKYIGIENKVYDYSLETGISSRKMINNLGDWEKVCSSASVFSFLMNEMINEHPNLYQKDICEEMKKQCRFRVLNNLEQFNCVVAPEIKTEAYKMLCEYWGEEFVKTVETAQRTEAFSVAEGESARTERE